MLRLPSLRKNKRQLLAVLSSRMSRQQPCLTQACSKVITCIARTNSTVPGVGTRPGAHYANLPLVPGHHVELVDHQPELVPVQLLPIIVHDATCTVTQDKDSGQESGCCPVQLHCSLQVVATCGLYSALCGSDITVSILMFSGT